MIHSCGCAVAMRFGASKTAVLLNLRTSSGFRLRTNQQFRVDGHRTSTSALCVHVSGPKLCQAL